jgi:hypothetical protein
MADQLTLGHFLPYLLKRRLRVVFWPAAGEERAVSMLLLGMGLLYGGLFGAVCNSGMPAATIQKYLLGLNSTLFISTLLVDFLPSFRAVQRPLPEHFPVSARLNMVTAFLLDFISLRRLIVVVGLLLALLIAQRFRLEISLSLLLVLSASAASFNLRLLLSLGRWRHLLLALHLVSLAVAGVWLALPQAVYHAALGPVMVALPWLLWGTQLWWLGKYFTARYLPATIDKTPRLLARFSAESQAYVLKAWIPLSMGLVFKIIILSLCALLVAKKGQDFNNGGFYIAFLPVIGFSYVNNNFFGYLSMVTANELHRVGLTPRLLYLYLRLVGPVVVADCFISAVMVLVLYPRSSWYVLGLLPLSAGALISVGLWASLYKAKPVRKVIDFGNISKNTSMLINFVSILLAIAIFFVPWWSVRVALSVVPILSVWVLINRVRSNDGALRRQLWRSIGA